MSRLRAAERSLRVVLAGLAAGIAACSLVYSSDLGDARSFPDLTSPRDGAIGGRDANSIDAASGTSDAGLVRGCAGLLTAPRFCADFDETGDPLSGWALAIEPGGNDQVVETTTDLAFSGPRALRASIRGAPGGAYTRVERTFDGIGPNQLEIRAKLHPIGSWDASKVVLAISIDADAETSCQVLFEQGASAPDDTAANAQVNVQSRPGVTNDLRPIDGFAPRDAWTELRYVAVPISSGGVQMTYELVRGDGRRFATTHDYPQCRLRGQLHLAAGFHYEGGNAEMRYDDIVVDWH